jgi:hypothetical protein
MKGESDLSNIMIEGKLVLCSRKGTPFVYLDEHMGFVERFDGKQFDSNKHKYVFSSGQHHLAILNNRVLGTRGARKVFLGNSIGLNWLERNTNIIKGCLNWDFFRMLD